jgi:uncharacterized protein (DUF2147 family)
MKTVKFFALVWFLITSIHLNAQNNGEADRIVGTWLTNEGKAKISIAKYGDKYGGKIIWLKVPLNEKGQPKTDAKNPDAAKKNNPLIGLSNLLGFSYVGNNAYENGTIYDPANGKTYSCNIKLEGDVLKVRGYIGVSLLGRTEEWTRVTP